MSAAATAAGYLYASGRLRGRGTKDEGPEKGQPERRPESDRPKRREIRVAVYEPQEVQEPVKPKRVPKIEYRTRRWKPDEQT